MNVIARLEYELAYYDSAVHRFNHYITRTPPKKEKEKKKKTGENRKKIIFIFHCCSFICLTRKLKKVKHNSDFNNNHSWSLGNITKKLEKKLGRSGDWKSEKELRSSEPQVDWVGKAVHRELCKRLKFDKVDKFYDGHTISFQTFFVWALLLIVYTWNSSPLRSNLLRCNALVLPYKQPL